MNHEPDIVENWDTIVVGGGPAGLACALWLARYRRTVCIFDTGEPRNRPAWAVHGFPGLPDPPPLELRARIRQQALDAGAAYRINGVTAIDGEKDAFRIAVEDGSTANARRVVLAYGLRDFLPAVAGIEAFYGHSVYHCPDCDGPSVTGQRVGVIGHDRHAAALALYLLTWAGSVTILGNGVAGDLTPAAMETLRRHGIEIEPGRIAALNGEEGRLREVSLETSHALQIDAIFFHLGSEPRCDFAAQLGCRTDEDGYIDVDAGQQTSTPGIYAAGDIAGHPHLAVTAAAEGVRAALAIHRSLTPDEFFVGG
ncbi:MAG TPA: NAD(P)/FAD-dependent oxidoreductase [Longimicrobiales bacterium]